MSTTPQGNLTPRQEEILLAIVEEHIRTGRAVPSKTVHDAYGLAASNATIRNEMAAMERGGYLTKPHTSGGRLPQECAYRLYVNHLGEVSRGLSREVAWVRGELQRSAGDLPSLLRAGARVLSELTDHPALAGEPVLAAEACLRFRLRPVSARAIRVTWETTGGGEREYLWEPPAPLSGEEIQRLSAVLEEVLCAGDGGLLEAAALATRAQIGLATVESLLQLLEERGSQRVYVEGTARLLEYPEMRGRERLAELLATLSQEHLARALLGRVLGTEGLTVLIGSEHGRPRFRDCSLVAETYLAPAARRGALGVLGPLRMSYTRAITAVHCVTRLVSQTLQAEQGEEPEE